MCVAFWKITSTPLSYIHTHARASLRPDNQHASFLGGHMHLRFIHKYVHIYIHTPGHLSFQTINTPAFWEVTWTFLFVEMFDSFGTLSTIVLKSGIMERSTQAESDRIINNAMLIDG